MLQTLAGYQDRMFEMTRRARANLTDRGPTAIADLDRSRFEMARLMTSYQLFVHREIFEPLIATGSSHEADGAKAVKVECIVLADDFRAYSKYWAAQDTSARWDEYRVLALAMIERVEDHARNVRRLAPRILGRCATPRFGYSTRPVGRVA